MATESSNLDSEREHLNAALLADDPTDALWEAVNSGLMSAVLPEVCELDLEQHETIKHKDILWHSIKVTSQCRPDLVLRMACLLHDVGKPKTRRFSKDAVTFRHHEAVGAKITRKRLQASGYDKQFVETVTELVRLSGRFKGYSEDWTDAAVRRYAREAGPVLGYLNDLVRADCTTKHQDKFDALQDAVTHLEERIAELNRQDQLAAIKPPLTGVEVMEILGLEPGPQVGMATKYLKDLHTERPDETKEFYTAKLKEWFEASAS